jgi:hypothetical protein
MKNVIRNGQYVIVDTLDDGDVEVPQIPNDYSEWTNSEWVFNRDKWLNAEVRPTRDIMLQKTDIYMMLDNYNKLTADQQQELIAVRQQLRDLTTVITYENPTYPTLPSFIK